MRSQVALLLFLACFSGLANAESLWPLSDCPAPGKDAPALGHPAPPKGQAPRPAAHPAVKSAPKGPDFLGEAEAFAEKVVNQISSVAGQIAETARQNKQRVDELRTAGQRLDTAAEYREPTPQEINRYVTACKAIGLPDSEVADIVNRIKAKGKRSLAREEQTCTNTPNHNKELGPARNQDSVGWCYAFAASDALSYHFGKKISAAALAVNFNGYFSLVNHFFQPNCSEAEISAGGDSASAIFLAARSGGACLESEVPSQDRSNSTIYSVLKALDNYKRTHKASDLCLSCVAGYYPTLSQSKVANIIETSSREQLVKNLDAAACKTKINLSNLKYQITAKLTSGMRSTFDALDQNLNNNSVPMITFASTLIYNIDATPGADHQMVVVSRRFNKAKNACEYLVRNSWGPGCSSWDKRLGCVPGAGSFWIEKSILARGLEDVENIK